VVLTVVLTEVLVTVLVTVLVVVDGSCDVVVSVVVVGVAETVLVSVTVVVSVVGAALRGAVVADWVIGVSDVFEVVSASPASLPKTDHTISASTSMLSAPAANIAPGVRYQGTGCSGSGSWGGRWPR
jgi:hypothetical protein